MPADVIRLPVAEPTPASCFLCTHALVGEQTYCRLYEEFVLTEAATAAECDEYREDENKT